MCIYIFAGRFQPFHNGHMQVFEQLCQMLLPTDTLVLGVVAPFESENIKNEEFLQASQEHHLPERNPWDMMVPLSAVAQIARSSHYGSQIVTTLLPRPEYGWNIIESWFPGRRVWVIPSAGEDFDEKKSEYFQGLGDEVKRIEDTTGISGRELRTLYINGNYEDFVANVPKGLADIYFVEKPDENAENDFQKRADTYEKKSKWVTDDKINNVPVEFFRRENIKIEKIFDAGGGTGYLSHVLHKQFKNKIKEISIVDISRNMLDIAKKKKDYPIKIHTTSIETFCQMTTHQFDVILIRQVLHYVENVENVIKNLKDVLRDGGVLYVGQILVIDEETQDWHESIMKDISKNRRRTFILNEFVNIFTQNGFEVIGKNITDYEERYSDLFERRVSIYEKNPKNIISNIKEITSDSLKEKMNVRFEDNDLYFKLKFCHLFLKKYNLDSCNYKFE